MPGYIHERPDWPRFRWDEARLMEPLAEAARRQGRLAGRMEALGFDLRAEAALATLTEDVIETSAIEGEDLNRDQVRSSLARRLGLDIGALTQADRHVDGVVEMMLDATQGYQRPLTAERLFGWHAALFPTGWSGLKRITVGAWRPPEAGPMQVVSGPQGRETVHFEAPEAGRLTAEVAAFLDWFEGEAELDPLLKAGVAHLWFVTLHPFEDGNGRISRAIADLSLTRAEDSPQRFYSMSARIARERAAYYEQLERTQRGDADITDWLIWFLACLTRAIDGAEATLAHVLTKARFWETHAATLMNDRQRTVINRLLDGFDGKLTSSKWAKLTGASSDTALRDINEMVERSVLVKDGAGGRSTSYSLVVFDVRL